MTNFIRNPKIFANFTKYYVHVDGNDSNSGTDWSNAFATIAQALTALGSNSGVIQLGAGTFAAPSTGIRLGATQAIQGLSGNSYQSQIDGSAVRTSGYAVVWIQNGRSGASNLWIINVSGVTGVRVTDPSNGTGIGPTSTENVRLDNLLVGVTNGGIAFGIGDNTSYDVSEICMVNCCSTGDSITTTHMWIGNGATGNVLDISNFGGESQGHQYGLVLDGSVIVSVGMTFAFSTTADIYIKHVGLGATVISGGRSENAGRFFIDDIGDVSYNVLKVSDYTVVAMHNTDGQAFQINSTMIIDNVVIDGDFAPQYIGFGSSRRETDTLSTSLMEVNALTSHHLYPIGGSPYNREGKLFRPRNIRFVNDASDESQTLNGTGQWYGLRRHNFITGFTTFTIVPDYYDALEMFLTINSSTITLQSGSFVGQKLRLTFIQDGIGGWTYTWPSACVFSGGSAPSNVTTPMNRQTVEFLWNGSFWEQSSAALSTLPAAAASNPVTEDFSNPSPPTFYLTQPYSGGSPSGTNSWISVPGGGAMGISSSGTCAVNCIGLLGDDGTTPPGYNGLSGAFAATSPGGGAGYVIETGLTTTTVGISTTYVYQNSAGIIFNYLNDQTFLMAGAAGSRFYVFGFNGTAVHEFVANLITPLTPGTTHTILVDIGVSSTTFKLDGVLQSTIPSSSLVAWATYTKHGFFATALTETFSAFSVS
jgi:hypothetical protein